MFAFQQERKKGYLTIIIAALITVVAVAVDQLTKWLAVEFIQPVGDIPIIKDVIHLTYVTNKGAAFGLLQNQSWLFIVIAAVICIACWYFIIKYRKKIHTVLLVTLSLITAGGIGNAIDRIANGGSVVDILYFKLINFAVFNFADACVTVGAIILAVYVIFFASRKKPKAPGTGQNEPKP